MTTRLRRRGHDFLPFNHGNDGGAGNPPNPNGHRTATCGKKSGSARAGSRSLGRYLVGEEGREEADLTRLSLSALSTSSTRRASCCARVTEEGAGGKYLIQHSAGSGKTNSIAWTAHLLADLHDAQHKKVFDSVLVVSRPQCDRPAVAGGHLRLRAHDGRGGDDQGRGRQQERRTRARRSTGDKKIVVCTIQTFPLL